VHSDQVGLPGGKAEKEDENLAHTAQRELHEELGILKGYDNIGKLSSVYIPPSNFNVVPFIGIAKAKPKVIPDPYEVKQVFSVSITQLLEAEIQRVSVNQNNSLHFKVPGFIFEEYIVWGATAMILSEFRDILKSLDTR
jgi:8-oxo-dGTP pyrophosphatase MutT (NUDIX family)